MPATRLSPLRRAVVVVAVALAALLAPGGTAAAVAPPGIPYSVSITAGDGSAVVSWAAPGDGGATISGYTVTAAPGGATAQVPGVAREATVIGLTNGVAYRFTVTATNRVGTGPASAVSALVVPTGVPAAVPGPVVLREDFATSPGGMDAVTGGTWAVASGRYTLSAPADGGEAVANANLAVHRTPVVGDFVLTATAIAAPSDSEFDDFSVVFAYSGPADYWFASFCEGNDGATSGVFRVVGGVRTELADITAPIVAGTAYPVRVERRGGLVRVFRGRELMASVDATALPDGQVGFGSRNDGGTFDDLLVTGPSTPPPPPVEEPGFFTRLWLWLMS